MATLVLSAAGAALGGSIGGTVLGLSMATIGQAAGATLGRVIDQRILGSGSDPVEVGRVDRFRLTGASEGAAVPRLFGRMRVPGQVIWATRFRETETTSGGGGKGAGPQPQTTEYSYSVSIAVALCEGTITRVGRVWADGIEVAPGDLNMRVYLGTETQQVDPKIEAVEGAGNAPAYRGIAYVVLEELPLAQFGNRVPQFTFEVMRPSEPGEDPGTADIARQVQGVALIPGTGEYALSTQSVYLSAGFGEQVAINENTPRGQTDYIDAISALEEEVPNCRSVSLVVSWFGSDLRCQQCLVAPKVEQKLAEGEGMPWVVAGETRDSAGRVPLLEGRPVYGGTPSDASVIESIRDLNARGMRPMFYPFILMEQMPGNGLPDPWSGASDQQKLPWRGRITLSEAPGRAGSPDGTATADQQVADFMGTAAPSDFTIEGETVSYTGPSAWRYRRFILHYAHLCKAAGGVSAFCIGSEMVGLTQIRGPGNSFPAVAALRQLAADCRAILGPETRISYAADWSEYHGYQPVGTGDKFFHLDPLWADPNIDFIGIDNYMPLSDWREGTDHADAGWGSIYNLDYLDANVEGGELFDWYYHSPEARDAQIRTPITDGNDEPWVWRLKDLRGWWENAHHERIGGVRQSSPTAWQPRLKPFWFTELGCAAIDKGTNQPNKFLDPKSSESLLPFYSNGMRDETMQMQYLRAILGHWRDPANNPATELHYTGRMLDMSRAHVWTWDARPFPAFPANGTLWSDGENYARGHWLNGRASNRTLASVVAEICHRAGVERIDVSRLHGVVRGYIVDSAGSARAALQPLMLAYGIEVAERGGKLVFANRGADSGITLDPETLALGDGQSTAISRTRAASPELAGRVQVGFLDADADYEAAVIENVHPDDTGTVVARSEFPLVLTRAEGARIAARWTHEARVATDTVSFTLPPSRADLTAGDVVDLGEDGRFRIDRVEDGGLRMAEATRIDAEIYKPQPQVEEGARLKPFTAPTPVEAIFMDLPLLTGDEVPHEPHVAMAARPWPGGVALYSAPTDSDYILQEIFRSRATVGELQTPLKDGPTGIWHRTSVEVKLISGELRSAAPETVFSGANTLAIGDGSAENWEIVQFADVQMVAPRTYRLSNLLRGQAGSDALMPATWPRGTLAVLIDGRTRQISLPTASRGNPRHYRWGPVKRPVGDRSFRHRVMTFPGNGYRPFPVAHLRAEERGSGAVDIGWIRRTRIDGDLWGKGEVPLGEETESYAVEVRQGGNVLHAATVASPEWTYSAAQRAAETGGQGFRIAVAQVSARYGPGPFTEVTVG